jgi:deoxyribodipyrimidine photo-lyase
MKTGATIVWLRQDLRTSDHLPLWSAIERGGPVLPVFVWAPEEEGAWALGGASRWWLHQSLTSLAQELESLGSRLIVRCGNSLEVLLELIRASGADAVYWQRRYEPAAIARDTMVKQRLRADGVEAISFAGGVLFEPWEVETKGGSPYKVFTPFWRACTAAKAPAAPLPCPERIPAPSHWPTSLPLAELKLEPTIGWASGMRDAWRVGSVGAREELQRFLEHGLKEYEEERNRPDQVGVSRLSPYLHFGEISPREVWQQVQATMKRKPSTRQGGEAYLRQLIWREFAHHLLYHFSHTPTEPLREEFAKFPWENDRTALKAWQRGRTGYPLVDAGMRELWTTGWMHNRVRLVVASFLVKDLRIHWLEGAQWFWDTLVDADLANNTLGWQWTAGCGADAAPYFRIFNPTTQSEKLDVAGEYIRRWVPELRQLPDDCIHEPAKADHNTLRKAGVELGVNYPHPIVEHGEARRKALEALSTISARVGK